MLVLAAPAFAQDGGGAWTEQVYKWALIAGAMSLGFAASAGAYSQSRAITAACDGMSRNPGASPQIRFALILGLALIESLVIYVLLIAFIIFLGVWGG
jgi:F-type H+-transporting ATPase subunit c